MQASGGMRGMRGQQFLTEEEKANAPKVTKELLLRILGYLRPYWPQFLLVFVAIVVSAVVGLLPSIVTGWIVSFASTATSITASAARASAPFTVPPPEKVPFTVIGASPEMFNVAPAATVRLLATAGVKPGVSALNHFLRRYASTFNAVLSVRPRE